MANLRFAPSQRGLTGTTVMVAEDDAIIGMDLGAMLGDIGCIMLGPYVSVADALASMKTQRPDAALLDVRLNDGAVTLVADALTAAGVPFALLTGTDDPGLPNGLTSAPRVMKPFSDAARNAARAGQNEPGTTGK